MSEDRVDVELGELEEDSGSVEGTEDIEVSAKDGNIKDINTSGKFGIAPLLFCGFYYVWRRCYLLGTLLIVLCGWLSLKYYFLVSLAAALFIGKDGRGCTLGSMVLSGVAFLAFVIYKVANFAITGGT